MMLHFKLQQKLGVKISHRCKKILIKNPRQLALGTGQGIEIVW